MMKKLSKEYMTNLNGGVTGRTCLLLGWATIGFAVVGQYGWAAGTVTGAIAAGCFDTLEARPWDNNLKEINF